MGNYIRGAHGRFAGSMGGRGGSGGGHAGGGRHQSIHPTVGGGVHIRNTTTTRGRTAIRHRPRRLVFQKGLTHRGQVIVADGANISSITRVNVHKVRIPKAYAPRASRKQRTSYVVTPIGK